MATNTGKIDHKVLLEKYMRLVMDIEGWSFLENLGDPATHVVFTPAELEELKRIDDDYTP